MPSTGKFLVLRAVWYIDLLMRSDPVPYAVNKVKIIGRKSSTLEVVSNITIARENVILVDPDRTAVAPKIEKVEG